jgi:HK97 family phage prohead protease
MMEIKDPKLAEQVAAWQGQHKRVSGKIERRYITPEQQELQTRMDFDDPKKPRMVGYAAVFNQRTELWPGFYETVAPGAFANAIQNDDVRALLNHDPNYVLGRKSAGTLTLSEDSHGLRYEIMLPDTTYAKDLQVSVKLKNITQSSFGFNIIDEDVKHDKDSVTRTIKDVKLFDVSPVTYPAYQGTEVHVRMIAGEQEIRPISSGVEPGGEGAVGDDTDPVEIVAGRFCQGGGTAGVWDRPND